MERNDLESLLSSQMMNAARTEKFRRRLIEERERIVAEWAAHGGASGSSDKWESRNMEERAVQITSDSVDRRIADDNLNLLAKVDLALQRIDDGTYTSCASCGGEIPAARLEAKPAVSLCIQCQELKDRGELQID